MKNNRTKTVIMLAILAIAGVILTNLSSAGEKDEKEFTGTITITNQSEIDYPDLATIDLSQALETGLKAVHGKAIKAELEEEDGYLVYSVEIVTPDHLINELLIDPGSGSILTKDIESTNGDVEDEADND